MRVDPGPRRCQSGLTGDSDMRCGHGLLFSSPADLPPLSKMKTEHVDKGYSRADRNLSHRADVACTEPRGPIDEEAGSPNVRDVRAGLDDGMKALPALGCCLGNFSRQMGFNALNDWGF